MSAFDVVGMSETPFGAVENIEDDSSSNVPRESMYVLMFEEMLDTVLHHEIFLFSSEELSFFQEYRELSSHARYLLIRLALRKTGAWFRRCKLEDKYGPDMGPHVLSAMEELWKGSKQHAQRPTSTVYQSSPTLRFAQSDQEASLSELIDCLAREELLCLAKINRSGGSSMTMKQLKSSLLTHTSTQTILPFLANERKHKLTTSGPKRPTTVQHAGLRVQVLKSTTQCIRIDDLARKLLNRLNLVYLRGTDPAQLEALLLPCVLNRCRKRSYPSYEFSRTATIFPSREDLLAYEEALQVEAELDMIQGTNYMAARKPKKAAQDQTQTLNPRVAEARLVRGIWEKCWTKWQDLVSRHGELRRVNGLERFECGHVLTRIISKGAASLAYLGEYELEVEVLEALLSQTRWRRGSRGAWWERLALIHMNHLEGSDENLEKARELVINGLNDPLTHMKFRATLERRIKRLETRLKVARSERHKCNNQQLKSQERTIEGVRVWCIEETDSSAARDKRALQEVVPPMEPVSEPLRQSTPPTNEAAIKPPQAAKQKPTEVDIAWKKGKSVWSGEGGEHVTVETFALQYYAQMGYKGVHAEGRVMGCLFSLLFWDILFLSVPGAFETPYQTAPLDLWEDTFYYTRQNEITARLKDLEDGKAAEIIKTVDERERARNTWCIGVRWDVFSQEDLLEIVECIGGRTLSAIGRFLAEDYSLGIAGVPDLFLWNPVEKKSMFVEVKGPGDTLSEIQKVWIDILVRSDMPVELCKVVEEGEAKPKAIARKKSSRSIEPEQEEHEVICISSDDEKDSKACRDTRKKSSCEQKRRKDIDESDVVEVPSDPKPEEVVFDAHGFRVFDHQIQSRKRKKRRSD